jgi:hypothetical protein
MNFVLDSSLTAAFLLEDEATTELDQSGLVRDGQQGSARGRDRGVDPSEVQHDPTTVRLDRNGVRAPLHQDAVRVPRELPRVGDELGSIDRDDEARVACVGCDHLPVLDRRIIEADEIEKRIAALEAAAKKEQK